MQLLGQIEDSGFSPSFSCYSSDSTTSTAVAKAIREEVASFYETENDDFEFSLVLSDEQVSTKEIDASAAITGAFGKLFIDKKEESSSCSSSEADELESPASGTYCVWRPKADALLIAKCKKCSSTGSGGSKTWRWRSLLRRSNSEGNEPKVVLTPKKKRNSGDGWNAHEQFYVQRRAENESGKRKSYLPYRKDLVGLFAF